MKWFRHLTVSHEDSKISRLLDSSGLAGYGAWWLVLEIIAGEMGKDDLRCSVEHSLARWARLLYCHPNQVKSYLGSMQSAGLVEVEFIDGRYRVSVPNLLKYRDEYSKKSGHATESVRTNSPHIRSSHNRTHNRTVDTGDKSQGEIGVPMPEELRTRIVGIKNSEGIRTTEDGSWEKAGSILRGISEKDLIRQP